LTGESRISSTHAEWATVQARIAPNTESRIATHRRTHYTLFNATTNGSHEHGGAVDYRALMRLDHWPGILSTRRTADPAASARGNRPRRHARGSRWSWALNSV